MNITRECCEGYYYLKGACNQELFHTALPMVNPDPDNLCTCTLKNWFCSPVIMNICLRTITLVSCLLHCPRTKSLMLARYCCLFQQCGCLWFGGGEKKPDLCKLLLTSRIKRTRVFCSWSPISLADYNAWFKRPCSHNGW